MKQSEFTTREGVLILLGVALVLIVIFRPLLAPPLPPWQGNRTLKLTANASS
jgi:hypothetical protein